MEHVTEIKGVVIKELKLWADSRGWLSEVFRSDESAHKPIMSYVSHTKHNEVRGPHAHNSQTDLFIFAGYGDFELYLWDNRKSSPTCSTKLKFVVGESNKVSVLVPPGVVHGYKSISGSGSLSINLPDRLYSGWGKKEKVDEVRFEADQNSPFQIK